MKVKKLIFISLIFVLINSGVCAATLMKFHLHCDWGRIEFSDLTEISPIEIDFITLYHTDDVTEDLIGPDFNYYINLIYSEYRVNGEILKDGINGDLHAWASDYGFGLNALLVTLEDPMGSVYCEIANPPWNFISGGEYITGDANAWVNIDCFLGNITYMDLFGGNLTIAPLEVPEPATIFLIIPLCLIGLAIHRINYIII